MESKAATGSARVRRQKADQDRAAVILRELDEPQVASNELTRDINRDVILGRIRSLQPISRVDLARASGLQPSTVSSIVELLLNEGWIREGAVVKTARGRRPTLIVLNDDLVILAADVRPLQAVVALLDLNGRFLERQLVPLGKDPSAGLADIAATMKVNPRSQCPQDDDPSRQNQTWEACRCQPYVQVAVPLHRMRRGPFELLRVRRPNL